MKTPRRSHGSNACWNRTNTVIEGHLSLDDEDSALARLKRGIAGLMETHRDQNQKFQEEVKLALQTMLARKQEAARDPPARVDFEGRSLGVDQLRGAEDGRPVLADGSTVGKIKNCKKGDGTLELGPDSIAPGAKIVIEAKDVAGFQLSQACEELEEARKKSAAQIGLFIYSRKTAPAGLDCLFRRGDDVFVIWDAEDAVTDLQLKLGLSVARALAVRQAKTSAEQSADYQAIDKAIIDLEKAINGLDEIQTSADTVHHQSEKMQKRIGLMREGTDEAGRHSAGTYAEFGERRDRLSARENRRLWIHAAVSTAKCETG